MGDIGNESESAFAQSATTFGECRRLLREGLNVSILGKRRDWHSAPTNFARRRVQVLQNFGLTRYVTTGIEQSLSQSIELVTAGTGTRPRDRGLGQGVIECSLGRRNALVRSIHPRLLLTNYRRIGADDRSLQRMLCVSPVLALAVPGVLVSDALQ
ncbi:hypothetical protein AU072_09150 [Mycolicibacterium novocastrense]|nr:hypothetical protein AU072_09150 [Mycolicibacterium novocastrense]